jgi:hypothetical protein
MKKTIATAAALLLTGVAGLHAEGSYLRCDTLINGDSIIVIETACAPICSSRARIYNKEWKEIGEILPPFKHAVFPEAYIEDRKIRWRDNTPQD